jgi:hypothetical protein
MLAGIAVSITLTLAQSGGLCTIEIDDYDAQDSNIGESEAVN